jgi:UDP-glucose 4-epimerase
MASCDSDRVAGILSGERVLVTGGCGFIGSHLVDVLVAQGACVWVLDNLKAGSLANLRAARDAVNIEIGDIRDVSRVRDVVSRCRPEIVFHLAANASVPGSVEDPVYDFETNSGGTFALLSALREIGVCKKVILASSGAVYGQPRTFPITEETLVDPISPYGASKAGAEITSRIFFRIFGMPVVIARVFNTYGPRMARFVILDFLRKLHRDPSTLEILGDGNQKRDLIYVSDTVRGLVLLAEHGVPVEAYNISSGSSLSVTEVAHRLISALGLAGQTRITYSDSSWPGDAQRWEVSNDKIRTLGFTPEVPLTEGLWRTIQWFQETESAGEVHTTAQHPLHA